MYTTRDNVIKYKYKEFWGFLILDKLIDLFTKFLDRLGGCNIHVTFKQIIKLYLEFYEIKDNHHYGGSISSADIL
ncbi:43345_t:CDS:2, partial [Gigaspora margarita]